MAFDLPRGNHAEHKTAGRRCDRRGRAARRESNECRGRRRRAVRALQGISVPGTAIGLLTSGATIASAAMTDASDPNGEFCKIVGAIHPVDKYAPDIYFQLECAEHLERQGPAARRRWLRWHRRLWVSRPTS